MGILVQNSSENEIYLIVSWYILIHVSINF